MHTMLVLPNYIKVPITIQRTRAGGWRATSINGISFGDGYSITLAQVWNSLPSIAAPVRRDDCKCESAVWANKANLRRMAATGSEAPAGIEDQMMSDEQRPYHITKKQREQKAIIETLKEIIKSLGKNAPQLDGKAKIVKHEGNTQHH